MIVQFALILSILVCVVTGAMGGAFFFGFLLFLTML